MMGTWELITLFFLYSFVFENNTHKERRINRGTDLVNNFMGLELEYIFATKATRKVL